MCIRDSARTTTKKRELNPDYGEAFVLSRDEDEPLNLVVMDADVLSSDDVMCSCTIQIQGREPVKKWYDLTDEKGAQKGRIQVVTHLVYDAVEFSERARLPPAGDGSRRANELCVVLRRAKDLRVADHSLIGQGSSDPFVVVRCDGASVQSRVVSKNCLLYTSPSPRDATLSRMPSSA